MSLPPKITLPDLTFPWTEAYSSRQGSPVRMVVLHTWGVHDYEHESIDGVVAYFRDLSHEVSSHLIYAGEQSEQAGRCCQVVRLKDKAWTEAAFNRVAVSIECSDRIWLGLDLYGLYRVARMTGWLLHKFNLPPLYLKGAAVLEGRGFTRHADLGVNGGGHPLCPTTDEHRWNLFCERVSYEYHRGGYRASWAL